MHQTIRSSTLTVKTAPTLRPVLTSEARSWSKVPTSNDDTSIDLLIDNCVGRLEAYLDRKIMSQTLEWFFDGDPYGGSIDLPVGADVASITSVKYWDTADAQQTYDASNYTLDSDSLPNRILLNDTKAWPTQVRFKKSYVIEFVAGSATVADVDNRIRVAILKMVASQVDEGRISTVLKDNNLFETAMAEVFDLKSHWHFS